MKVIRTISLLPIVAFAISCGGSSGGSGGGNVGMHTAQEVVANAAFPTALRFSPGGDLIYIEKSTGNVRKVANGSLQPTPVFTTSVNSGGERGMLGLAVDPDYATNQFLYLLYTKPSGVEAEIVRIVDGAGAGQTPTVIVPSLPAANIHNGGRIEFGPDGKLYVTIGDVGDPAHAQSDSSLAGKVLRYNPDGSIPNDNPINGNPIFSKGHRNAFGMAIHNSGTVFVSENGPNCDDEVNRLTPNGNFGWRPGQPCGDSDPSYLTPLKRFSNVIAPTGMAIGTGRYSGGLLMGSFNDSKLRWITLDSFPGGSLAGITDIIDLGDEAVIDVTIGPDGNPYVATSSRILRLVP